MPLHLADGGVSSDIHLGGIPVRQAGGIYVPHAGFPCDIGLSDEYTQGGRSVSADDVVALCAVCGDGKRIYRHGFAVAYQRTHRQSHADGVS